MEEKQLNEQETSTADVNNKPQFAVFDWIVSLPVIRILKPLYEWKKAFWIYCFLGFVSTASNYVFTIILANSFKLYGSVANVLAWLLSTFISFVLFRYFYFDRTNNSFFNEKSHRSHSHWSDICVVAGRLHNLQSGNRLLFLWYCSCCHSF